MLKDLFLKLKDSYIHRKFNNSIESIVATVSDILKIKKVKQNDRKM